MSIAYYEALPKASFEVREAIYLSKSMLLQPLNQPEAVRLMMRSSLKFCQPQPESKGRLEDVEGNHGVGERAGHGLCCA